MWIRINCGRHWIKRYNAVQSQIFGPRCDLVCTAGETYTVQYDEVIEIGDTVAFKHDTGYGRQEWGKAFRINSDEAMVSVINMIQTGLALEAL